MIRWRHRASPIITKSEKHALRELSSSAFTTTQTSPFQSYLLPPGFSLIQSNPSNSSKIPPFRRHSSPSKTMQSSLMKTYLRRMKRRKQKKRSNTRPTSKKKRLKRTSTAKNQRLFQSPRPKSRSTPSDASLLRRVD